MSDCKMTPIADADWPVEIADMRGGFAGKLNVYRVMAHHPALLAAWRTLRNHVVLESALTPAQSEIVILRTGLRWKSPYEWGQHVVRGMAAGLTEPQIAQVRDTAPGAIGAGEDALLIAGTDALLDEGGFGTAMLAALTEAFGKKGALDVIATVGMYTTLAFLLNSHDVPLEPDMADALAQTAFAPDPGAD